MATACTEHVMICARAGATSSILWLNPILVTYGNSWWGWDFVRALFALSDSANNEKGHEGHRLDVVIHMSCVITCWLNYLILTRFYLRLTIAAMFRFGFCKTISKNPQLCTSERFAKKIFDGVGVVPCPDGLEYVGGRGGFGGGLRKLVFKGLAAVGKGPIACFNIFCGCFRH